MQGGGLIVALKKRLTLRGDAPLRALRRQPHHITEEYSGVVLFQTG
jgi:hypothetical protein